MRPVWKSDCCDTCRKRKVKCDGKYPICGRCSSSEYTCERRYQEGDLVHVPRTKSVVLPSAREIDVQSLQQLLSKVETPQKVLSQGCLFQVQLLSYFLEEFVPPHSTSLQTFSYFEGLPKRHGTNDYIDIGSAALSLVYLGQIHGDKYLLNMSQRYYELLLKRVSTAIKRVIVAKKPTEDEIIGVAILSMYEIYNPMQESSWSVHVRAICNLIATRGPETPIDSRLLCFVRTLGFYESIGRREVTFPQSPRWEEIIPKNEPFEQLLSIVLALPQLEWLYDKVEQTASAQTLFVAQFTETYSRLRLWYLDFVYSQKSCSFQVRAAEPDELSFLEDYPELKDVFPEVIIFSDPYAFQLLLLCWTGFFVLNYEASKFMRTLYTTIEYAQDLSLSSPPQHNCPFLDHEFAVTEWSGSLGQGLDAEIPRVEARSDVFAERICQALVYADKHTNASAMKLVIISPLWILQQYFINKNDYRRSLWCQCALQSIPPQKVGFSSLLTKLSVQQYQALGGGTR